MIAAWFRGYVAGIVSGLVAGAGLAIALMEHARMGQ